jgi:DNA-binding transcriptional LysR family regulator
MNLSDLLIFKTVVEKGSITRAAESLHRVQSNVTTRILQLEDKLDVALFVRKGKRLSLSPAGRTLLPYAEKLLLLAEQASSALLDDKPRGSVTLGSMESTAAVRLPAPLSHFVRDYPEVKLTLKTGNPQYLTHALISGKIDAALITGPIPDGQFEKVSVFREELVIVAAAGHPTIDVSRGSLPSTILAFELGCPHRARLEKIYAKKNCAPLQVIEISSYHAMLGCVAVGMGISLMPLCVLTTFPERKRLSVHSLPKRENSYEIDLIWRKEGISPVVIQALIKALKPS